MDTGVAGRDFAGCYSDIVGCCGHRSCQGTQLMTLMMQLAANHRSLAGRWTCYLLVCVPYYRSVLEKYVPFEACSGPDILIDANGKLSLGINLSPFLIEGHRAAKRGCAGERNGGNRGNHRMFGLTLPAATGLTLVDWKLDSEFEVGRKVW